MPGEFEGSFSNMNIRRNVSSLGQISNIQYPHPYLPNINADDFPGDRRHIADIYRRFAAGVASGGGGITEKTINAISLLVIVANEVIGKIGSTSAVSTLRLNTTSTTRRVEYLFSSILAQLLSTFRVARKGSISANPLLQLLASVTLPGGAQKLITAITSLVLVTSSSISKIAQVSSSSLLRINLTSLLNPNKLISSQSSLVLNFLSSTRAAKYLNANPVLQILNTSQVARKAAILIQAQLALLTTWNVFAGQITTRLIQSVSSLVISTATTLNRARLATAQSSLVLSTLTQVQRSRLIAGSIQLIINAATGLKRVGSAGFSILLQLLTTATVTGGQSPIIIVSIYPFELKITRSLSFQLGVQTRKMFDLAIERTKSFDAHITRD